MRRFGTVLAERRLAEQTTGAAVRVTIGVPRPGTNGADWECPFRIHGAGIARVDFGCGVDSMQALTTALDGIRYWLDESGLALGWNLGRKAILDGETGFTRSIPITWAPSVRKRIERLVDRQIQHEVQRLERRSTRASAAKARTARKAPAAGQHRPARKGPKAR